ncbi:MAG: nicotinamide-nucleotide amidase, partial [Fimbriimonadaceae bacterium]|nr:nicotinamide-nucleotide amidase [Fimbriimonadaceae bacterium]
MTAEIVSIGNELMDGFTVDTHAATMSRMLAECGVDLNYRQTVRDDWEPLVAALKEALSRSDIVITIGGLGPTGDDLTREAIAEALGEKLVLESAFEERLKKFFEDRKMTYTEHQRKQAMRPECGQLIENSNGTAPALLCEKDGKTVIALPGPKGEFVPLAEGFVRDHLCLKAQGGVIASRTLKLCGIGESQAETRIKELMYQDNPRVAPYAQPAEVHLRITAKAKTREEALKLIEPTERKIREILGDHVFGVDNTTLEESVLDLLKARDESVAVAESLTGGELGARFSNVVGASDKFRGGVISYATDVKELLLGVKHETLEKYGPVSEQTAREMALGARERIKAAYGVSLTGNAGPTSDKDQKPIGLVYIGIAGPKGIA